MTMPRRSGHQHRTFKTLLLVGEGETDVAFLTHVKSLCAPRGCGLQVKVICAHGKGARHVVDVAKRHGDHAAYDTVAALLDTDTDWTEGVRARARSFGIRLLLSDPRIEAMLLRALGHKTGNGGADQKRRFACVVKDPLVPISYEPLFDKDTLQRVRQRERAIDDLLQLFGL